MIGHLILPPGRILLGGGPEDPLQNAGGYDERTIPEENSVAKKKTERDIWAVIVINSLLIPQGEQSPVIRLYATFEEARRVQEFLRKSLIQTCLMPDRDVPDLDFLANIE